MKLFRLSLFGLFVTLSFAGSALAQTGASFAAINFPGAHATGARGVNIHGEIVGWFQIRTDCVPQESAFLPASMQMGASSWLHTVLRY
ncbi:MAG TPA: hypothetical protein VGK01_13695 [Candidatus Angelobacter sp.]|jgi:hypothetical protein